MCTLCAHTLFYSGKALKLDSNIEERRAGVVAQQPELTGLDSQNQQRTDRRRLLLRPHGIQNALVASLPRDTHVHAAYGLTHVHAIRNTVLKSWRQWDPGQDQNKVRNASVAGWVLYFTCAVKTSSHTHMYSDSSSLVIKREKTLKKLRYPIHDQKIQKLFFHCWSIDSMPCQL